ncbi:hypothetical protein GPX89_05240 [Nocardia sp. ET3-3]|uniref:Uncharacterized protein n=1 Tax=Nocardia terrae TaxID=2675851 RepID=A0A7K1UR69_9NOCA|nr:hypothetical protein [Nocardia terrae]MVU76649.1 hypothetical protein [Nocardia terrae]
MSDSDVAPTEEIERRRLLADRVRAELRRAGLPAHDAFRDARTGGAAVGVDSGNDMIGGVFIDWRPAPALTDAVVAAAQAGEFESAAARQSLEISVAMSSAIIAILRAAGLHAEAGLNDLSPDTVFVESPDARGTA